MKKNDLSELEKDLSSFLKKNSLLFGVDDKIEKQALSKNDGLKQFAGGPARKISSKQSSVTVTELAVKFEKKYGIFSKPPTNEKNKEVLDVIDDLLKMFFEEKDMKKRIQNGAQAVVRNPILRGDYGVNTVTTIRIKGFDRLMIDTGQFFNSIIADVGE